MFTQTKEQVSPSSGVRPVTRPDASPVAPSPRPRPGPNGREPPLDTGGPYVSETLPRRC